MLPESPKVISKIFLLDSIHESIFLFGSIRFDSILNTMCRPYISGITNQMGSMHISRLGRNTLNENNNTVTPVPRQLAVLF